MIKRFALLLLCALTAPGVSLAQISDVSCDDSGRLAQRLTQVLGADRQATGLRDPETVLEIWVTRHSGDWLIVQS